ncbi:MAG: hypothetical protein ACLP0J_10905 [Solirubrobacteraceae bacterium]
MADQDDTRLDLDELRAYLAAASLRRARNRQAITDGTADPRVLEALKPAYDAIDAAPEDWRDMIRQDVDRFVTDEFDNAANRGAEFDPHLVGIDAVAHVQKAITTHKEARKSVRRWMHPSSLFDTTSVREEIATARNWVPMSEPGKTDLSNVTPWWSALLGQNRHILAALERLADNADEQKKVAPILFWLAVVGTTAAVIAAIAAVVAVVLAA